jgi:hypothetical protein
MKSAWARRKAEFSHEFRTPAEQSWRAFCTTAVRAAIRYGLLPSLDGKIKCTDCDAPAKCYDHRDYNRPIDVEPVCLPCNTSRHKGVMPVPRDFPRLEAA